MKVKNSRWLVLLVLIISKLCLATVCTNAKGTPNVVDYSITDELLRSENALGYTFEITKSPNSSIGVQAICPQGTTETRTMRSYVTDYPVDHTEGNLKYILLNDYLEAAISIKDYIAGEFYPPVNYVRMGNEKKVSKHQSFSVDDSNLKFTFRIKKPFVGSNKFNLTPAFHVYVTTKDSDSLTNVVYNISYSGEIIVPQSCEVNTNETITFDFGNIGANAFSHAGAGNKPESVNPQTRTVGISCKNMEANALLSMRLETNLASGNAMVSDNKDLGFIIADKDKKPLTPNNIDSKIPFQLDDNAAASVPITAWPVSITGNKPAEGKFTAEGYLRVDFD